MIPYSMTSLIRYIRRVQCIKVHGDLKNNIDLSNEHYSSPIAKQMDLTANKQITELEEKRLKYFFHKYRYFKINVTTDRGMSQ